MTTKAEHITLDIRRRLAGGDFTKGDRFDTFAELQDRYGVTGVATIQTALDPLWNEGILRSEQGRGTFVQRIPAPPPEASAQKDVTAVLGEVLAEIAEGLAQLGARIDAARALLNPRGDIRITEGPTPNGHSAASQ
jgi:DNA-binding GntR family transcriptional regulator